MKSAAYTVEEDKDGLLVIRDVGPWTRHQTVTNDAENVVASLFKLGMLPTGRKLLYFDSEGELGELLHDNGQFTGFRAVVPARAY